MGDYVPGTPGAGWTEEEVAITRQKLFVIMEVSRSLQSQCNLCSQAKNWKPVSNGYLGHLKMPKGRAESWPSENKLMRIAFHDCLKYKDGSGGENFIKLTIQSQPKGAMAA